MDEINVYGLLAVGFGNCVQTLDPDHRVTVDTDLLRLDQACAQQQAFYYVRVLEIPTPRWTAYDAKRFNVKMDPEVPMTLQERAYTSPIWYIP